MKLSTDEKTKFLARMAKGRARAKAEREAESKANPEPEGQEESKAPGKAKPVKSQRSLVRKLISQIAAKLAADLGKATLGDLIKLLQIEKELPPETNEETKEIRVMWVDPEKQERP